MLLCAACLCLGQLIWKLMPGYSLAYIAAGFAVYGVGALSMILAYRHGELSVLQPMNSMSYVFSLILAALVLHERVPFTTVIGALLIVSGVIVMGLSGRKC